MARQSPLGMALMVLLPPPAHRRVHVGRARHWRQRLAGLDLVDDLKLELTGALTTFESQGWCLLALVQEAELLVSVKGAVHGNT
jgi:hypothetical protein